ncbi:MAG: DUF1566 domain-containing protein [Myxococcota bacterium]|nr:DUF1566 domain-containing protein [Myxococcota bacterium]
MKTTPMLIAFILIVIACKRGPEGSENGDCQDKKDNDYDGQTDCDDPGCLPADNCQALLRQSSLKEIPAPEPQGQQHLEKRPALGPSFDIDGLLVQSGHNGADINWLDAEAYCKNLSLAGKSGWRLPTQKEALLIVESDKIIKDASYVMWTSDKTGKKRATIVGITGGAVNDLGIHYKGQCRARCVHGNRL